MRKQQMSVYQFMLSSGEMVYTFIRENRGECRKNSHKVVFEPGRIDVYCNHKNTNLDNVKYDILQKQRKK